MGKKKGGGHERRDTRGMVVTSVALPAEVVGWLRRVAEREQRTMSWEVRRYLEAAMEAEEGRW